MGGEGGTDGWRGEGEMLRSAVLVAALTAGDPASLGHCLGASRERESEREKRRQYIHTCKSDCSISCGLAGFSVFGLLSIGYPSYR